MTFNVECVSKIAYNFRCYNSQLALRLLIGNFGKTLNITTKRLEKLDCILILTEVPSFLVCAFRKPRVSDEKGVKL